MNFPTKTDTNPKDARRIASATLAGFEQGERKARREAWQAAIRIAERYRDAHRDEARDASRPETKERLRIHADAAAMIAERLRAAMGEEE